MEYLVDSAEMKELDRRTIEEVGIPALVLMERAALETVRIILEEGFDTSRILVVCGTGNNGGDGAAIARLFKEQGCDVSCVLVGDRSKCSRETRQQLDILASLEMPVDDKIPDREYTIIIDALFGIGLTRVVAGNFLAAVEAMNGMKAPVVAVDIPSGIHSDTGAVMGGCVKADLTVTFACKKLGLILYPGSGFAGRVVCADIGIPRKQFRDKTPRVFSIDKKAELTLPQRQKDAHKGTFGKITMIAGSINMAGAALLAGKAAFWTGAGMVNLCSPLENRTILQTGLPEALFTPYEEEKPEPLELLAALEWATAVVIGPGLSQRRGAGQIFSFLLSWLKEKALEGRTIPCLIDGDGLNLLAGILPEQAGLLREIRQPLILTPHLLEMERLCGIPAGKIKESLIDTAAAFAKKHQITCVLKDVRTAVASKEGRIYLNQSGNHGMATAGSGDVLTGIVAGLLAQGLDPFTAAYRGVYLHGRAGDSGSARKNAYSLTALDIIDELAKVLPEYN